MRKILFLLMCALLPELAIAVPDGLWNGKAWDKAALEKSVKKGDPEALAEWAYWSKESWGGIAPNDELIFKYAKRSAKTGNPYGQAVLARCYLVGRGTEKDEKKGVALAQKSAKAGHPLGLKNLANSYRSGAGDLEKNVAKSIELTKESASQGCVIAMENEMIGYYHGSLGMKRDKEKALALASKLCKKHQSLRASWRIVESYSPNYENFNISADDLKRALARIQISAKAGDPRALSVIGLHLCKIGRPHEGIPIMLKGAQTPNFYASPNALDLAGHWTPGKIKVSAGEYSTIMRLARDAYKAGNHRSGIVKWVADSYLYPWQGNQIDVVKAEPYVRILYRRKFHEGHHQMGHLYYNMTGSKIQDKKRGVAHFEYASSFDNQAIFLLGDSYILGPEKERDYIKGYAVKKLATTMTLNDVQKLKHKKSIEDALKHLNPEELKQAKELVKKRYPIADEYRRKAFQILKEYGDSPENESFKETDKDNPDFQ